ncbi:UDP-N-acetylglucosamine 1-carboxyvinyltransferase [Limimonas halophila]|uniref:UDP-N-acetylglucosamine 1-carboxyvinyltransferase n=1 Tax=Limimonas halophila TaxID=1082479 RepID=A0A1G7QN12_9PROT|nr:UDP-N-acetylglucosamine 1-carboxyvinyltransferase [Limimonas halophila]SDF99269.1 UDP-N-acetylglucosamine 1-carboxyvinyltransferase [Limimonas halophila]
MERICIQGGRALAGRIPISGAKNAALPLMAASLLTDDPLHLSNLPDTLADITTLATVLEHHGVRTRRTGPGAMTLQAGRIENARADYDLVRRMRASVLVLGPLLARQGYAEVSMPGGCAIGTRPVDLHLRGLEALGATIELREGYIVARAPRGLTGGEVVFPHVSVGATENVLMAAALARGTTRLVGAAREPEVCDLAHCLMAMGAEIEGIGTDVLTVHGARELSGASHAVIPDRIEAGTYAMAAGITGGELELIGARAADLPGVLDKLAEVGVEVTANGDGLRARGQGGTPAAANVTTEPYPGFPTDLQAQFMALMTLARGESVITETIFENRFLHVCELERMGADIRVEGGTAVVHGRDHLDGAPVMASDLRASAGLVLAGLAARGETVLHRVYHLDRGYERLVDKLAACGAAITREPDDG